MRNRMICATLALILVTGGVAAQDKPADPPQPSPLASVTLPPELDRVLRDYETAWMAKDAAGLAKLFTEDGFVLSNQKVGVRGWDSIKKAYANAGGPLALRALAWSADGSTGYIIGAYAGSKDAQDWGKFILALRKGKDGRWMIAADIDNTNQPPQRRAAPPAQ